MQKPITTNFQAIGPFTKVELEGITEQAYEATRHGKKWVALSVGQKDEMLQRTVGILTNNPLPPMNADSGKDAFTTYVLTELRNSSRWDENVFVKGFPIYGKTDQIVNEVSAR